MKLLIGVECGAYCKFYDCHFYLNTLTL